MVLNKAELRILYLNESISEARYIKEKFEDVLKLKVNIDTAESLYRFMQLISGAEYDVIIVSNILPKLNAPEAVRYVKEKYPHLPVFIVTDSVNEAASRRLMELGATDYFFMHNINQKLEAMNGLKEAKNETALELEALNTILKLLSEHIVGSGQIDLYSNILSAAIKITNADKGIILIRDETEGELKIAASHGLGEPFLAYFSAAATEDGHCGIAYREGKRVLSHIREDIAFKSPEGIRYLELEEIITEQASPLISSSGAITGVLDTFYTEKKSFNDRDLRFLDMLSRPAADLIERAGIEKTLIDSRDQALSLADQLKKADQYKNKYLAAISHELRNPLSAIADSLLLMDITDKPEEIKRARTTIDSQVKRVIRIVDDLIDISKASQNIAKLRIQKVDINEIIEEAIDSIRYMLNKKSISFKPEFDREHTYIEADPLRISQVITNLLHNACKFTPEGGEITLTAEKSGDRLIIRVSDNGIGIEEEILPVIFELFAGGDEIPIRSESGLGMGLVIAKRIVELHGGAIEAFSEGAGKGAVFTVCLPIKAGADMDSDNYAERRPGQSRRGLKIIIIDDQTGLADIKCKILGHLGHEAYPAVTGAEGIELCKKHKPDVVICDLKLPDMDGFDVIKAIRSERELKDTYMVAMTGYSEHSYRKLAMELGYNQTITKPVDMMKFGRELSEIFAK